MHQLTTLDQLILLHLRTSGTTPLSIPDLVERITATRQSLINRIRALHDSCLIEQISIASQPYYVLTEILVPKPQRDALYA